MTEKRKGEAPSPEAPGAKKARADTNGSAATAASSASNGGAAAAPAPAAGKSSISDVLERARKTLELKQSLTAKLEAARAAAAAKGLATKPPAAAPASEPPRVPAQQAAAPPRQSRFAPLPNAALPSQSVAAAGLQAAAQLSAFGRPGMPALPLAEPAKPKAFQPAPLRLDDFGREIDEHGNVVKRSAAAVTTLKINQKKEQRPAPVEEEPPKPTDDSFYDPELGVRPRLQRKQRASFNFVEEGRFQKQAEQQRVRAQFGDAGVRAARERAEAERRAAKAAPGENANLVPLGQKAEPEAAKPKPEEVLDPIPDVEWWDARLLTRPSYEDVLNSPPEADEPGGAAPMEEDGAAAAGPQSEADAAAEAAKRERRAPAWLKVDKITHYVEHPVPLEPPIQEAPPEPMPLMLTPKERKKLRTQRRVAKEKEKQDLIRQGLLEPPKPKVKLSNMMRVMGAEATADPTAVEAEVRKATAERSQAHEDRNLARKLTPAERREKKERKLTGQADEGEAPHVSLYRLRELALPQHRFKVRVNAEELHMTGCALVSDGLALVLVEGGPKALKRYAKLMLRRIDWAAPKPGEEDAQPDPAKPPNRCELVWQGIVATRVFSSFVTEVVRSEAAARKFLANRGIEHYWDLAAANPDEPPLPVALDEAADD